MAISRSLMNRQLQANGGIMQVAPREKFGLGSKLKKFVRKIIPNEVAEIATKAAPFVAPFNPLLAAGMSGIGTFDKTGSIGDSLKAGGMNYALGQGARYIGGGAQNLQTGFNPFSGYDASAGLTRGLLTNPVSDQGGLGKFFANQGTQGAQGIQGIGTETTGDANIAEKIASKGRANLLPGVGEGSIDLATAGADGMGIIQDTIIDKSVVAKEPGFLKNMFDGISNQDYGKVAKTIGDGAKKFGKAMFYDGDKLDRAAVMGAIAFAGSYAEAKALAADAGVEITPEEYDESRKAEKQEEYAGYLTNFFGGKKDGGRIGFESGANEMIKTQLLEEIMPETTTEDFIIIMTEDGPVRVKKTDMEEMPGMFRDTTTGEGSNMFTRIEEADGGRIGLARGSEPEEAEVGIMTIDVEAGDDEDEEDMDMDMAMAFPTTVFSSSEISRLFRDRSLTTNLDRKRLFKVLMNPGMFPEGEKMLIRNLRGKADGGRIGYKGGANRVSELLILRDELIGKGEDVSDIEAEIFQLTGKTFKSVGGISDVPTGKIRKNNAGVTERDYRDEGGFVPVGIKERADDVPAMLSKNEFVMTADAVRGIGNGSVEEGSKKLYNTMKKAEQVGKA